MTPSDSLGPKIAGK